ncbi:MAG: hypothetical protein AAF533_09450 [Acidobacteriota bacterium]
MRRLVVSALLPLVLVVSASARDRPGERRLFADDPPPVMKPTGVGTSPHDWCGVGEQVRANRSLEELVVPPLRRHARPKRPNVSYRDGILVIEDDGSLTDHDNEIDLVGRSLELIPSGDGFAVLEVPLEYETGPETELFTDAFTWTGVGVELPTWTFPFGGEEHSRLWITSDITVSVSFDPPTAPSASSLCGFGCWVGKAEALGRRQPRVAPLQLGTRVYGWNAGMILHDDRAVITWRSSDGGALELDVQAVLFADGRIRFNYLEARGLTWGAPTVVTGNESFWSDRDELASVSDPAGDVVDPGIPVGDRSALDIVGARAAQVADSEILELTIELAGSRPTSPESSMIYVVTVLEDEDAEEALTTAYGFWNWFGWRTATQYIDDRDTELGFHLFLSELDPVDDDLLIQVSTLSGTTPPYVVGDSVLLDVTFTPNDESVMLDLSEDLPVVIENRPIFESFALPDLLVYEVGRFVEDSLDFPPLEGIGIYQNFLTDIFFYAGGYSTGGNSGADGIGFGSSAQPESPALLHLHTIYNYGGFDWAMTVLSHELGHRWLYHFTMEEGGMISRRLNPVSGHPAGWVSTPAVAPVYLPEDYSCMGGSGWVDNGDGTFTATASGAGGGWGFSWTDLYLMGLAEEGEIPDWWYVDEPSPAITDQYWPPAGVTVSGTRVPVSVDQVVAAEGPRFPAYPDTRTDFLMPLVLVTRPGTVTEAEIDAVETLCDEWQRIWPISTAGRSTMRCAFHPPEVAITDPPINLVVAPGTTLSFSGEGTDEDDDAVSLSWRLAGLAPAAEGEGPHELTFVNEGVYQVELSGVDALGMPSVEPAVRTIVVDCTETTPPDEVEVLRLWHEPDDEIRFTWSDVASDPADYLVLAAAAPDGNFEAGGSALAGDPGLLMPLPVETTYYRVVARYTPGCLGP